MNGFIFILLYVIIGVIFWICLYITHILEYKKSHWNDEKFSDFYDRKTYNDTDIVLSIFWLLTMVAGLCILPIIGIKLLINKIFKVY